jgi:hypothetical protein
MVTGFGGGGRVTRNSLTEDAGEEEDSSDEI